MNVCLYALVISLSVFSSSIHFPAELITSFFFTNGKIALCIVTTFVLPIHQLMNISAFFPFLAIEIRMAINMDEHVSI